MNELYVKYRFWISRNEFNKIAIYLHNNRRVVFPISYRTMLEQIYQQRLEDKLVNWEYSVKFIRQPWDKLLPVRLDAYLIKVMYETIQQIRVVDFKYFDENLARLNGNLQALLDSMGIFEQTPLFDDYELGTQKLPGINDKN